MSCNILNRFKEKREFKSCISIVRGNNNYITKGFGLLDGLYFNASFPFELGYLGAVSLTKKIVVQSSINYAAFPLQLIYNDHIVSDTSVNLDGLKREKSRTIHAFKIPTTIRYYFFKPTCITAGVCLLYSLRGNLLYPFDLYAIYGHGCSASLLGLENSINYWLVNHRALVADHFFTYLITVLGKILNSGI